MSANTICFFNKLAIVDDCFVKVKAAWPEIIKIDLKITGLPTLFTVLHSIYEISPLNTLSVSKVGGGGGWEGEIFNLEK